MVLRDLRIADEDVVAQHARRAAVSRSHMIQLRGIMHRHGLAIQEQE